jgi:hypothetical protein
MIHCCIPCLSFSISYKVTYISKPFDLRFEEWLVCQVWPVGIGLYAHKSSQSLVQKAVKIQDLRHYRSLWSLLGIPKEWLGI